MANVSRATNRGVSLETASIIIETALQAARRRKPWPMTIAVLDAGGDLVAFKREDGNGIRRFDVVMGKAVGSLVMNRPSRVIGQIGKVNPMFIQSIGAALQGRLIPSPGGVLIKNKDGEIIGAVRRATSPSRTRLAPSKVSGRRASCRSRPSPATARDRSRPI
jgi:uncharacterized protein GlcG (DUF336 family)